MSTPPVFVVPELPSTVTTVLDGPEGRHAATVRRLRSGEPLALTDGRGGVARCEVTGTGKDRLELRVLGTVRHDPPRPRVVLAQALVKGDRGELAVELATEAGVDEILPWRAARCVTRWDGGPRGERAHARWRSSATAAAKQSRRAWVPEVAAPVSTAELAAAVRESSAAYVLESDAVSALGEQTLSGSSQVLLVVGPEGGVAPDELATLEAAGARAVRLGPEVLRASTAAAVALGALGVLTGRWGSGDVGAV